METSSLPGQRRSLADLVAGRATVLMEGAVVERVRREAPSLLDARLMNAPLIYDDAGRTVLGGIYGDYVSTGRRHGVPLLLLAPTWRATPERISASPYAGRDVNGDAVRFLVHLRSGLGDYASSVYVGGLLGCRGDAYRPGEALARDAARAFHEQQAGLLARAGADFLMAATMPESREALGMAEALAATAVPYLVSFIVRPSGCLLDGTPLDEAIGAIDALVSPRPAGYLVNCVHSSTLGAALSTDAGRRVLASGRLLGLQANTSSKSPEELDGAEHLDTESAADFAAGMCLVRDRFGLQLLGGCCGTDGSHIAALARAVTGARDPG